TVSPKRPVNRSIAASRSRTTTVNSTTSPNMARLLGTVERDHTVESHRSTPHGPIIRRRAAVLLRLVHRRDRVRHDGRRRQRAHRVLAVLSADSRRVRLVARDDRGRVLLRLPGLGDPRPGPRPDDGPARPARGYAPRRGG